MSSNYIAEIFCVIARVSSYSNPYSISLPSSPPPFAVPDVLIHCTTTRAAKIWSFSYWKIVVDYLVSFGFTVGIVGSDPRQQSTIYNSGNSEQWLIDHTDLIDLRGRTSLMELAGALSLSKAFLTVDAGPLDISAAVGL